MICPPGVHSWRWKAVGRLSKSVRSVSRSRRSLLTLLGGLPLSPRVSSDSLCFAPSHHPPMRIGSRAMRERSSLGLGSGCLRISTGEAGKTPREEGARALRSAETGERRARSDRSGLHAVQAQRNPGRLSLGKAGGGSPANSKRSRFTLRALSLVLPHGLIRQCQFRSLAGYHSLVELVSFGLVKTN